MEILNRVKEVKMQDSDFLNCKQIGKKKFYLFFK
jgi:hypothetical protein